MEEGSIGVEHEGLSSASLDMAGFITRALGYVGMYFLALVAVRLAPLHEGANVGYILEEHQIRAKLLLSVIFVEKLCPETARSDGLWCWLQDIHSHLGVNKRV